MPPTNWTMAGAAAMANSATPPAMALSPRSGWRVLGAVPGKKSPDDGRRGEPLVTSPPRMPKVTPLRAMAVTMLLPAMP